MKDLGRIREEPAGWGYGYLMLENVPERAVWLVMGQDPQYLRDQCL